MPAPTQIAQPPQPSLHPAVEEENRRHGEDQRVEVVELEQTRRAGGDGFRGGTSPAHASPSDARHRRRLPSQGWCQRTARFRRPCSPTISIDLCGGRPEPVHWPMGLFYIGENAWAAQTANLRLDLNREYPGCPARIRTSIDGVRVRSLTVRRRGNAGGGRDRKRPPDCQRRRIGRPACPSTHLPV